MKKIREELTK